MTRTKYLKGHCQACGGHLEFPAEAAGMATDCPHCGQSTDLLLAPPPDQPTVPRRTLVWTGITVLLLIGGLAAALIALKRMEDKAAARRQAEAAAQNSAPAAGTDPIAGQPKDLAGNAGFRASEVSMQKTPGSSLVYASGSLTNATARQRFGVKVVLDLYDASGNRLGEATDYQQVIEPNAVWSFKALVVDSKAASAKLAAIKEDQ